MTRLADDPAFWASLSRQFDQVEEMLERLCDGVSVEVPLANLCGDRIAFSKSRGLHIAFNDGSRISLAAGVSRLHRLHAAASLHLLVAEFDKRLADLEVMPEAALQSAETTVLGLAKRLEKTDA